MAEMGELVNNLQNTQRKKNLIFPPAAIQQMKTATECVRKKAVMMSENPVSKLQSVDNQTDLGRSLPSWDLNFFYKVRLKLLGLFTPHSSHEQSNTIVDGKALLKKITSYINGHTYHHRNLRNVVRARHWLFHKSLNSLHILILFLSSLTKINLDFFFQGVCWNQSVVLLTIFRNYLIINCWMQRVIFGQ